MPSIDILYIKALVFNLSLKSSVEAGTALHNSTECHWISEESNLKDTGIVKKIIHKLLLLPEVKQSNHYIDSFSNHARGISFRVMQKPNKSEKYYWISVGYNSDTVSSPFFRPAGA